MALRCSLGAPNCIIASSIYKDVHFYQDCGQEHALVLDTQANKYASWTKGMESNVCPHDFMFSLGTNTVYSDRGRVGN